MGQGVAVATKEGGKKRGQRVAAVSSPVVVVVKGRKGQGVAATATKQGGERKRGQSRVAASSSPVPVVGGRSEIIVAPEANATVASGSNGGNAILPPQFSAAAGKQGMSNEIALPPSSSLDEPGNVRHRSTAEGPSSGGDSPPNDPPGGGAVLRTPVVGGAAGFVGGGARVVGGEHCRSRRSLRCLRRRLPPKVPHQSVPKSTITTTTTTIGRVCAGPASRHRTQQPLPPLHRR